jgi:sugar/nucleoside kinase (ribokinase family)
LVGEAGEGIVEQIDGIIELGGVLYFVEMKWYRNPVGKPEISEHLVRLMSRAEVRGIFISASDYTEPAIHTVREFLQHKVLVLSTLHEIVRLLEQQTTFRSSSQRKSRLRRYTKTRTSAHTIAKDKVRYDSELDGHQ